MKNSCPLICGCVRQIADKLEISSVLTQWQKMPSGQHFPACSQCNMVVKVLDKARMVGI
ncbi:hypothetical protein EAM_0394 [Erwinia amylovora ATCC 49946]|nr:hypothetical protein EAM_0394 [Erwinia amylovora ATCC 49946]